MSDQGRIKDIVVYILQALYHCVEAPWPKDSMIGSHLVQFEGLLNALTRLREIDNLLDMYLQVKMYGNKEEKEAMKGGLKILLAHHPHLSFQFMDYKKIVPSIQDVISSLGDSKNSYNRDKSAHDYLRLL